MEAVLVIPEAGTPEALAHLELARVMGAEWARTQNDFGRTVAEEDPLSSEWADAPTFADVFNRITGQDWDFDLGGPDDPMQAAADYAWELSDEWERGYNNFFAEL
jgi:hypothetical protein